jgi:signal transduction histidine kinase
MSELILAAGAVAALAAGGSSTWHFRQKCRRAQDKAQGLGSLVDQVSGRLGAVYGVLNELTTSVLPSVGATAASGRDASADLVAPVELQGTDFDVLLRRLARQLASSVSEVRVGVQLAADHQMAGVRAQAEHEVAVARSAAEQEIARIRSSAEKSVAGARRESEEATRAAVRSLTTGVVVKVARLTKEINKGVWNHQDDGAYETLVQLDHLGQQLLLTAQGYGILAGDRPSRRHPPTSVTDVIRSAMGRIEGHERVQHHEQDLWVESRAVEAVIHTLAVLIDNALRYSPPTANVYVSVEQGHHACLIHVDDAGLRMNEETLLWAGRIMSGEQRDDITRLGAEPQTGLRVVSLLAGEYGFRVDLAAPNSYAGTRATLVLPKDLTVAPPARVPAPVPAALPAPGDAAEPSGIPPATATTASGLAVRTRDMSRQRSAAPSPSGPVTPGNPDAAAAWATGSRLAREESGPAHSDEGN